MKLKLITAIFGAMLLASPASAKVQYEFQTNGIFPSIWVVGEFSRDDDLAGFENLIIEKKPEMILFDSAGGDIRSSMHHGRIIRKYNLTTAQMNINRMECLSACVYAFMGGKTRMAQGHTLGIHQASLPKSKKSDNASLISDTQMMVGAVLIYMQEMGVDLRLAQYIFSTTPDNVLFPTEDEMIQYQLTTERFPEEKPETGTDAKAVGAVIAPIPEPKPQQ